MNRPRLAHYPQAWELFASMVAEAQLEERERRNAELFEQVQQGIDQLKALQQPVTQRAISNMIEIPHSLLRRSPHILRVLQQHSQHQIFQESALLCRLEAAREQIEQEGKPVTQAALIVLIGVSSKRLRKFPRIRTLLDEVVVHSRRHRLAKRSPSEEECLAKIEAAVQMTAFPEPITQLALCRLAGIPPSCMYSSPRVKAKVKDVMLASRKADQLHRI